MPAFVAKFTRGHSGIPYSCEVSFTGAGYPSIMPGVAYQSSNGVPNADNLDPAIIRQAQLVLMFLIPRCLREGLAVRILAVGLPHLCEVRYVYCREDTDVADQAGDRTYGESATREAKEEQLVARHIVIGDEIIDLAHIYVQTPAEGA
jgi:hypothetical protein